MIDIGKFSQKGRNVILEKQTNGCMKCISHCCDSDGYTRIRYNGKHERLFRVIYIEEHGDIPKGMLIRHKCDNPWCCNIEHLEIGTPKDNVRDMIERHRDGYHKPKETLYGENNGSNKLTKEQVADIYLSKLGYKKLSIMYGVSTTNIRNIKKKLQWRWFTDTLD